MYVCMSEAEGKYVPSLTEFVVRTWSATSPHVQYIHINVYTHTYNIIA